MGKYPIRKDKSRNGIPNFFSNLDCVSMQDARCGCRMAINFQLLKYFIQSKEKSI